MTWYMSDSKQTIAIPIEDSPLNINTNNNENENINQTVIIGINSSDQLKSIIYSRARTVKLLIVIDLIFLILNLIISLVNKNFFWIFFLFFPLCLIGYKGANDYNKDYLKAYLFYLFIMILFYLGLVFYYASLILLIVFIIELYIFSYCLRLHNFLSEANNQILDSLRDNWNPDIVTLYYI